jgi:hypothetical protein
MATQKKADWLAVKLEYINSSKSIRQVAEEFGVGESAAKKRSTNEGWDAERKRQSKKVTDAAQKVTVVTRAQELAKFNEDDVRVAKAIRAKAAGMLQSAKSPSEIRALALAFDTAQKIGRLALGATTDNTGHSDPNGGPIPLTNVSMGDYLKARAALLKEF